MQLAPRRGPFYLEMVEIKRVIRYVSGDRGPQLSGSPCAMAVKLILRGFEYLDISRSLVLSVHTTLKVCPADLALAAQPLAQCEPKLFNAKI